MMRAHPEARDVYLTDTVIASVGRTDLEVLKERVAGTDRKRVRLCTHRSTEDRLQEMIIAFEKGSYIRPSRHIGKEESIHVLDGTADFVFLDGEGRVTQVVPLGPYRSGRQFYCRTPEGAYHTLVVRSGAFLVQETTQGPFRRADTAFAAWAPEDSDGPGVRQYLARLTEEIDRILDGAGATR